MPQSARNTTVVIDRDLAREVKIEAAKRGIPMKQLIEAAINAYLKTAKAGRQG